MPRDSPRHAKLRVDSLSKEEQEAYYRYLDNMNSLRSIVDTAREDAAWENFEKGEKIGIEKGEKLGIQKAIDKLMAAGMSSEKIAAILDIDIKDIQ